MLMEFEGVIELANNHYGRQKYLISPLRLSSLSRMSTALAKSSSATPQKK